MSDYGDIPQFAIDALRQIEDRRNRAESHENAMSSACPDCEDVRIELNRMKQGLCVIALAETGIETPSNFAKAMLDWPKDEELWAMLKI